MMPAGTRSGLKFLAAAVLLAGAGVLVVYGGQIDTGLYYDDYHFVRPVHPLELRRVWFGSWDPTGIESPFFRPLTAWLFALRFWLFGLNTTALHAISVAGHLLCAIGVGWMLRREGAPTAIALAGVWFYTTHPLFPFAQVSWLTNQMHLAESIVVIGTLLLWQSVRDHRLRWSVALVPLAVTGFLIKEDAVMLLPVVFALTGLRGWLIEPALRKRTLPLLSIVVFAVVAMVLFRHQRLGRLGGYGVPGIEQGLTQLWRGLDSALLLWPTRTPWQAISALIAITVIAILLVRWKRTANGPVAVVWAGASALLASKLPALSFDIDYPLLTWQGVASGVVVGASIAGAGIAAAQRLGRPLWIMITGLTITLGFNAPFVLVSKREQYHLIALGAVLMLAGGLDALRLSARASKSVVAAAVLSSMPLALLARSQAAAFRPCAAAVLAADADAAGWWILPNEIRGWLSQKQQRCDGATAPPRISELPVVSWGLYDEQEEDGIAYRWTSDEAVLIFGRDTSSAAFGFRRQDASAASPVRVTLQSGRTPIEVVLDSTEWTFATVRFAPGILTTLRQGHRVDIGVTPWFVPALRDPTQLDVRRFGVQFRIIEN